MKVIKLGFIIAVAIIFSLAGCNGYRSLNMEERGEVPPEESVTFQIGVLVGAEGIDDKSFNQIAWEGVVEYISRFPKVKAQMIIPDGDTLEDNLTAADELITIGSDIIIGLGPTFNETIAKLQDHHRDTHFILIDGELEHINSNTLVVSFAEHEAGFLAGVIAALQSSNEKLGFIGGEKNANIERYGLGFVAGIAYANKTYNTDAEIIAYEYQGDFNDVDGGQKLAKNLFDEGIDTLFVAARATGIGAMNEAKTRAERDERIQIIGADRDQFKEGILGSESSVVLTSVVKQIDLTLYELLDAFARNKFPGGTHLHKNVANKGVGLPATNKNLRNETEVKIREVISLLESEAIKIPKSKTKLIQMIESFDYPYSRIYDL